MSINYIPKYNYKKEVDIAISDDAIGDIRNRLNRVFWPIYIVYLFIFGIVQALLVTFFILAYYMYEVNDAAFGILLTLVIILLIVVVRSIEIKYYLLKK